MPLTPENLEFVQSMAEAGAKPFHAMSVAECRTTFDNWLSHLPPSEQEMGSISDRALPAAHGAIPVRVYTPEGFGPFGMLVYLHGGGWVIGSLDAYDNLCVELAARAGVVVVSVDYRLAPEAKFPAAPDDCFAALQWVAERAASLSGDPNRIVIGGDSAGGNLAAVTALRARDAGGPALCGQLLIYPVTKNAGDPLPSRIENAEGPLLTQQDIDWFLDHYIYTGNETDALNPDCSPLFAESFAGLPPALVQTAEFDPLRDEGEAYAKALEEAGNEVKATRYDGAFHGMLCFPTLLKQSEEMMTEIVHWLRRRVQ